MQKVQKKVQKGMVGRQSVPIQFKWAAMVSTLRTTAIGDPSAAIWDVDLNVFLHFCQFQPKYPSQIRH